MSILVLWTLESAPALGQTRHPSSPRQNSFPEVLSYPKNISEQILYRPDSNFRFLHDCVITSYKNTLYTAWYNCPDGEIEEQSVIRGRYSNDYGKTWSSVQCFAQDSTHRMMYVPPAFSELDGALYLYVSRMSGHDQVHDVLIFKLNESTKTFVKKDSISIPFIINTSVTKLQNGKLIAGGRRSNEVGSLPLIPAILISDSGSPRGPWRAVDIQSTSKNPDGSLFEYPETGLIIHGPKISAIVRGEQSRALIYESADFGNSWSPPNFILLPISGKSKITAGTLSNGRDYVIGNREGMDRDQLIIAFRNKGSKRFMKTYLLQNGPNPKLEASPEWSYPSAHELHGKLYIIYTSEKKSASMSVIPLDANK